MVRSHGSAPGAVEFYAPVLGAMREIFGSERLIYASNWPVSDLYAKYETVFTLAARFVEGKGKAAFARVFGKNAMKAYRL